MSLPSEPPSTLSYHYYPIPFSQQEQSGRVPLFLHRAAIQLPQTETAVLQAGGESLLRPEGENLPGTNTGTQQHQDKAGPGNVSLDFSQTRDVDIV